MKHMSALALLIVVLSFSAGDCLAQVFGHFSSAGTVGRYGRSAGAYFIVSDDVIGLLSQFRYGPADALDIGLQIGVETVDERISVGGFFSEEDDTRVLLAGDAKYLIRGADEELPFDISLDFGVGYVDLEDASRFLFKASGQGAWRGHEPRSRGLEPYIGLVVAAKRTAIDLPRGDETDIDNDLEVRLGTVYRLSAVASVVAELQAGDDTSFGLGLNFEF